MPRIFGARWSSGHRAVRVVVAVPVVADFQAVDFPVADFPVADFPVAAADEVGDKFRQISPTAIQRRTRSRFRARCRGVAMDSVDSAKERVRHGEHRRSGSGSREWDSGAGGDILRAVKIDAIVGNFTVALSLRRQGVPSAERRDYSQGKHHFRPREV